MKKSKNQDVFKVSHSKIKVARRCLKAYYYKYVQKLRKRVKSRPLIIGSLVHSCIESHFRNGYYLPEITKWKSEEFNRMFKEEQALNADIIPLVKSLIRGYIKSWDESGLSMVWVEKDGEVEIAPGIFLVFKIDGMAQCDRGFNWLIEHKTCKKMPGEEVRIFDTQAILYSRMMPMIGEPVPQGVVWDYVRTKPPAKPELLKGSGCLSKRKNIDTLPEVYAREVKRHGLDIRGYEDIIQDLSERRNNFYRQIRLPFNKTLGDTVMDELVIDSRRLIYLESLHASGQECFTRNLTRDCSWCDYKTLCHAELKGDDVDLILKHDYRVGKVDDKKERETEEG